MLPIIGTLDSARAARLTESLLEKIAENQAEVVILNISGVPTIDTQVTQHLLRTVQAATLIGATSIRCMVRPETRCSLRISHKQSLWPGPGNSHWHGLAGPPPAWATSASSPAGFCYQLCR